MVAFSLLLLLLVTGSFAAPFRRDASNVPASSLCLPGNQDQLVAPAYAPSFVTVAVGFQNYTCSEAGVWEFSGAIAQLYDITCLYPGSEFSQIQDDIYSDWTNPQCLDPFDPSLVLQIESTYGITLAGQFYFTGDLNPVVDFRSDGPTTSNPNAIVVAEVIGDVPSPAGNPNIDWQEMTGVSGQLANIIFQVNTHAGMQVVNESCEPGYPDDSAKFTAQIWLYGSQV